MNKSMIMGIVFGGATATAVGTVAGYNHLNQAPSFAQVINVTDVTENYTTPREECADKQVTKIRPVKDEQHVAGTAIGALVGGLIGKNIGGGSGKKIATVAGAIAGGYTGKKTQETMQQRDTYTEIETVCYTVHDQQEKVVGYDVEYKLGEVVNVVRMDHKPDQQIPVKDGQLVLTQGTATQ